MSKLLQLSVHFKVYMKTSLISVISDFWAFCTFTVYVLQSSQYTPVWAHCIKASLITFEIKWRWECEPDICRWEWVMLLLPEWAGSMSHGAVALLHYTLFVWPWGHWPEGCIHHCDAGDGGRGKRGAVGMQLWHAHYYPTPSALFLSEHLCKCVYILEKLFDISLCFWF